MQIIYGTKNVGKLKSMRECLSVLEDVSITGLSEIGGDFPDVEEDGIDPLSNARKKALAYFDILKKPVFSVDSGLYFDNLSADLQPGLDVRRVNGKRLTDDEMIAYYSDLARAHGGGLVGRYRNGICLVAGENRVFEHMGDDIATEKFRLVSKPHKKREEGFPIDSLSVHIESGEYYFDRPAEKEAAWHIEKGFLKFFTAAIQAMRC